MSGEDERLGNIRRDSPAAKALLSGFALESAANGEVEGAGVFSFVLGE